MSIEAVYRWARLRSRRRKAALVVRYIREHDIRTVLFVGSGQGWEPLDLVVEQAAASAAVHAVACDLHVKHNLPWPYVRGDGLRLPFADDAFDLVLSNAVVEHVGGAAEQRRFVAEHVRVGRRWLLTTPNRWFPFEPHTKSALLHWLPGWRARRTDVFTRLLSRRELRELLPGVGVVVGRPWSATFVAQRR